jgi:ABC-2 type transport system ATP-binding protein
MIVASNLTRRYGNLLAVRDLSFEVGRAEVVGFLGQNGAGKTTTLRMLAGSLAVTDGSVAIGGFDMATSPRDAKRLLGYLPERPPLYDDMRVRDYVAYAARLHEVAEPGDAADEALVRAGVDDVRDRYVGHLSKGYRQRVGLAAAIAHRPRVLLLDEPASGLDPVQRVGMRSLIRELAEGEVTVLLSSHVLAEVADVCDRVLVLHEGRLVGDHTTSGGASVRIVVARPEGLEASLEAVPGVEAVERDGDTFVVRSDRDVRAALAEVAVARGLLELTEADDLEALFLRLVGG